MSSLAAIALEIENSRPQREQQLRDSSVRCNFFGPKKLKSCSWSNYFVEERPLRSGSSQATVSTANLDAVPEKSSFPTKKLRDFLRLLSSERSPSADANEHGDHLIDWVAMSAKLSTKSQILTARDCYIHYNNVESKDINKGIWGANEDRKLLALVNASEECGWVKIADDLGTSRTPLQCLQRYQQALNAKLVNSTEWNANEDALLRKGVELYGTKNWQNVASMISGRSAVQCGARYRKSSKSRDDIVDGSWTEIDERRLFLAAIAYDIPTSSIFKKSPAEIEAFIAAETEDTPLTGDESSSTIISSRLNTEESSVRQGGEEPRRGQECVVKEKKKYNMTRSANIGNAPIENEPFIKQSQLWAAVAKLVPGKNDERCREKWVNSLDPDLKFGPFISEEYALLKKLVDRDGVGNWAEKSLWFPGRTDANLMARWKTGCMSDESERKDYKATAKLRRDLSVPALSRGALASTTLSERDFTPVLSADPALFAQSSAPVHATSEVSGAVDSEVLTGVPSSSGSSSSSSGSSSSRNNGSDSSSSDLHPLPLTICSICDNMVYPVGTPEYQPDIACVMCRSVFHLRCSESEWSSVAGQSYSSRGSAVENSQLVCRICQTMSMIEESAEAQENVPSTSVTRPSAIPTKKRSRKVVTEPDPHLEVPPRTRKTPRNKHSPTAKNKKDSAKSASATSHSECDSGIHPDILAALEACESSELT